MAVDHRNAGSAASKPADSKNTSTWWYLSKPDGFGQRATMEAFLCHSLDKSIAR